MLFALSLPTLFAFLRPLNLLLALRYVALRLLLLLSPLFPTLLPFLALALLLLATLFPTLLSFLTITLLLLPALFPTLLLLHLLLAALLGLYRLAFILAGFSAALSFLLSLLARSLIFLPPLLTAATPALRIREIACAEQQGGCR